MIIGVDDHPSFQTIAFLMEETGECGEQEVSCSAFASPAADACQCAFKAARICSSSVKLRWDGLVWLRLGFHVHLP
jgi:hypothetical protein